MANEQDILRIIKVLEAAFPNFHPNEMTPETYYQTLRDIQADELKAAVLHCVTEPGRAFAPSIGEIRGTVAELRRTAANVPGAYDAWQEVCRQIADVGSYKSPEFSSPLIDRVVRSLGWRNLCMSENAVADRARFIQAYEQLLNRALREETMLPEVKGYLQSQGAQLLDAPTQLKQLSERLSK